MNGPEKLEGLPPQTHNLSQSNPAVSGNRATAKTSHTPHHTDSVDLSSENTEYHQILKRIAQEPEIRQDHVDRIRHALENGTYHIDADSIANRLLRETLMNEGTTQAPHKSPSDPNTA